jgi:hypothetical protein
VCVGSLCLRRKCEPLVPDLSWLPYLEFIAPKVKMPVGTSILKVIVVQGSNEEFTAKVAQSVTMEERNWLLFACAGLVRLLLFTAFPSLSSVLAGRVEVSTPVTSFKRRTLS